MPQDGVEITVIKATRRIQKKDGISVESAELSGLVTVHVLTAICISGNER